MLDLRDKKVLVVGSGISGIGAVKALCHVGAHPILYDANEKLKKEEVAAKLAPGTSIQIVIGALPKETAQTVELVVLSPGVPTDTEFVEGFRARGIRIWGEIELAYRIGRGRVIGITGTNGKTTTTSLVGEIMAAYCGDVDVVGNIGNPYTLTSLDSTDDTVTVAEISSFQLETVEAFAPQVSAILNITPDHLNRHHTMEKYAAAKEAIAGKQSKEQVCVLNYENDYTRDFGSRCPARVVWFSSRRRLENGFYEEDGKIYQAIDGQSSFVMNIHDKKIGRAHV